MSTRDWNIALAVGSLAAFWYFAGKVEPQPVWLRWATWW
jgi:hypothetical protein